MVNILILYVCNIYIPEQVYQYIRTIVNTCYYMTINNKDTIQVIGYNLFIFPKDTDHLADVTCML